jgi:precorrin-6B C5,15-methyltransferase / cobalt-precorrin-6B C5,C15-methyltransferase
MKPVDIVGVGLCFSDLSRKYLNIIRDADILVGGRRHLSWFDDHPGEKERLSLLYPMLSKISANG